jgi:transposase, IS30 family
MSHLTPEQRYTIASMKQQGYRQNKIAETIGKDKSVVNRELKRNRDERSGAYRSDLAQRKYEYRKSKKNHFTKFNPEMKTLVNELLIQKLSPEQIVGFCRKEGVEMVNHESIYQYIWKDKKRNGRLYEHLRSRGKKYKSRGLKTDKRGQIVGRKGIENRPQEVEKRERLGDLEIDTIIGKDHKGVILTINDRATGMLWMRKLESKDASKLAEASIELLTDYRPFLKTITSDNGKEFSAHQEIAEAFNIDFYFAKPYASWQRGSNENLNGLIRQYIPKKTDFNTISADYIEKIVHDLNRRPRKRYNFESPLNMFNKKSCICYLNSPLIN